MGSKKKTWEREKGGSESKPREGRRRIEQEKKKKQKEKGRRTKKKNVENGGRISTDRLRSNISNMGGAC